MARHVRGLTAGVAAILLLVTSARADRPLEPAVADRVDALLGEEVFAGSTDPLAPTTTDVEFLRRATLDLVGQLPTPDEVRRFVADASADKRRTLIERLLADSRYGVNWGRYWRDVIFYRRIEDRALLAAGAAEKYLTEQFNNNVPWDEIASSFIETTGDVTEDGSTALVMAQGADTNDVASEVSRIFMGVQIQCAQCHDHPTDRWKREQFHEFAAFFPRIMLRPVRVDDKRRSFEVASRDRDFGGRGAGKPGRGSLEHYMPDLKDPGSQGTLITPVFFANQKSLPTGTDDMERRETIADWITSSENEWFAKAVVNRLWSELVGEGFYEPIDDIGPDRHATAPRTLDYLAGEFVAHGYDMKWLAGTIMLSDAYQRTSRPRRNAEQTPFVANVAQPLRSDQLLDVLLEVTGTKLPDPPAQRGQYRGLGNPRMAFSTVFGFDPSERRSDVSPTIAQALVLMNGSQMNRAMDGRASATALGRLLADEPNNFRAVTDLYLRTLARSPSIQERDISVRYVESAGDRQAAFEDLFWALINRTEFAFRN